MSDYYTKEEVDTMITDLKKEIQSLEFKTQYSVENEKIARRIGDQLMQEQIDNISHIQKPVGESNGKQ